MTVIDKKLAIYEAYTAGNINNIQKEVLLEAAESEDTEVSIPELSFIKGKIKYQGKDDYLLDKNLLRRINSEYVKMLPKMNEFLTKMMKHWELDKEHGIKTLSDLKSYMTLDCFCITKFDYDNGGYEAVLFYNNDGNHTSENFFEYHSFMAAITLYNNNKVEYDFNITG